MVELTTKQELFSQLVMNPDMSYSDAYRMAYNVSEETSIEVIYANASRMMSHSKIKTRVRELRVEAYQAAPWGIDKLRATLTDRSEEAADAGQYGPSVRALEMIGKLDGLIVDKKEIAIEGTVTHVQLSTDELRQLILDGRRIASQYGLMAGMETVDGTAEVIEEDQEAIKDRD